tara:strand:- start:203 stop:385 length:183 start_codon:yes stop_codon:yes gene_type:complete
MIVLAFVLGCMCSGMMEQMCGQRLVEGFTNFIMHPLGGKGPMRLEAGLLWIAIMKLLIFF